MAAATWPWLRSRCYVVAATWPLLRVEVLLSGDARSDAPVSLLIWQVRFIAPPRWLIRLIVRILVPYIWSQVGTAAAVLPILSPFSLPSRCPLAALLLPSRCARALLAHYCDSFGYCGAPVAPQLTFLPPPDHWPPSHWRSTSRSSLLSETRAASSPRACVPTRRACMPSCEATPTRALSSRRRRAGEGVPCRSERGNRRQS